MNTHEPREPHDVDEANEPDEPNDMVTAIRGSLEAKLERLLQRPLIAGIGEEPDGPRQARARGELFDLFGELEDDIRARMPTHSLGRRAPAWRVDPTDKSCTVRIEIDYDDLWRGSERDVLDDVKDTIESSVTFLTDAQRTLLERAPREFLALRPPPETAELVSYETERVGGVERVVSLTFPEAPEATEHLRHLAIVPNLIPLQRQLDALQIIDDAAIDGEIAPLRALLGLPHRLSAATSAVDPAALTGRLDEFQRECVRQALATPHFALIQGPPGSGKTTAISSIIAHVVERGGRALIVSPTHVAVDNVVEKLAPAPGDEGPDDLTVRTLPVRYAPRRKQLLETAAAYRVGPRSEERAATISKRLERALRAHSPFARELFKRLDPNATGQAYLSQEVASVQPVICGTPIGVLSYDAVKYAEPGSFDLLVVDEVSKMTLPEFLAIAVKARRWVLVGDPQQLPPYLDAEEAGTSLDELISPTLDLVCSVSAILERARPSSRPSVRLVAVSSDPERVAAALRAHIREVGLNGAPRISTCEEEATTGVVLCHPEQLDEVRQRLPPQGRMDRSHNPWQPGNVSILVERGLAIPRPAVASGARLVEPRLRASAALFGNAFNVYHAQPWAHRSGQKLAVVSFRKGFNKYLPSAAAIEALAGDSHQVSPARTQATLLDGIALRYAVNAVSVYDWLAGMPVEQFDVAPLRELVRVSDHLTGLQRAVAPFVGTLRKQYRMHPSLSLVPRDLFYFGEALEDGLPGSSSDCRVRLMQVPPTDHHGELNEHEAEAICELLVKVDQATARKGAPPRHILIITPYRAQERHLNQVLAQTRRSERLDHVHVEVCTLDRAQGREAEFVFISLVRSHATVFLDAPKRWNVALTRARQAMFIFGDIDAYLSEARGARHIAHQRGERPHMSLLSRILETYDHQIQG